MKTECTALAVLCVRSHEGFKNFTKRSLHRDAISCVSTVMDLTIINYKYLFHFFFIYILFIYLFCNISLINVNPKEDRLTFRGLYERIMVLRHGMDIVRDGVKVPLVLS